MLVFVPAAATLTSTRAATLAAADAGGAGSACCAPASGAALEVAAAESLAAALKALAEPSRLRLLSLLAGEPAGEVCLCDLTGPVGLSQPTVSHHMKVLVDAGLVDRDVRGRWSYYRLVPGAVGQVTDLLSALAG